MSKDTKKYKLVREEKLMAKEWRDFKVLKMFATFYSSLDLWV